MSARDARLDAYRAVVGLTPQKKRPIYRTRYHVRCSCGWTVSGCDYIDARRLFREHWAMTPAHRLEGLS